MKIKQYVGTMILLIISSGAWAQRPVDNRVEFQKSKPAVYYLPEGVNSMGIDIQMDNQVNFQMSYMDVKKAIYEAVELPITQEVYSVEGSIRDALDLVISVKLGSCKRVGGAEDLTSASGGKYWKGAFTFPISLSWEYKNHPNSNFKKEFNSYSEDGQYHYETQHYSDFEKMSEARMIDIGKAASEYFNLFLDELRRDNEPYYAKVGVKASLSLYTLKDKKIDFTPVDKAFATAKAGLEMTNPEDYYPTGEAAQKVKDAIVMYQEIIDSGNTGKRGDFYLYSNIMQLQNEIGEFSENQKTIDSVKKMGGMFKMTASAQQTVLDGRKKSFDEAGIAHN